MKTNAIKNLLRAKNLIATEQYEGALVCIDVAISELYEAPKQHCTETCEEPGGYCECKSELNKGE
jgi:hypothetical protein